MEKKVNKKNPRRILGYLMALAVMVFSTTTAYSQCQNTSSWGSANAPSGGLSATMTTCAYQGDFNYVYSVPAGESYTVSATGTGSATTYATVRDNLGAVVAYGLNPLTWTATSAGTHTIHWNGPGCATATNCLTTTITSNAAAIPPPANDDCINATSIACGDTLTGTTANATIDDASSSSNDVWYTITGNGDDITASLCGSSFDTKIRVRDACGGTIVVDNDDYCSTQSQVTWTSVAGTTYLICVTGYGSSTGNYSIALSCTPNIVGCTDAAATNYNASANISCSGCCVYPVTYVQLGSGQTTNGAFSLGKLMNAYYARGICDITYQACELASLGLSPGDSLNSVGWYCQSMYGSFDANVSVTEAGVTTAVWSNSAYTPSFGWNDLSFSSSFVWGGGDIMVSYCFDNSAVSSANLWQVTNTNFNSVAYYGTTNTTTPGCNLYGGSQSPERPNTRFAYVAGATQAVAGCTDSTAINYNASATIDDCSCICTAPAPIHETFSSGLLPVGTCVPNQWVRSATTGDGWRFTGLPNSVSSTGKTSGTFAWIDFSSTDAGVVLEVEHVDISTLTTPTLIFDYFSDWGGNYQTSASTQTANIMHVEAWDGSAWQSVDVLQFDSTGWNSFVYSLSTNLLNGTTAQIRFRGESGGASYDYWNDLCIDDVKIENAPVLGCTDQWASNFNAQATLDDGSCLYPGCLDPLALNYCTSCNDTNNVLCIYPACDTLDFVDNFEDTSIANVVIAQPSAAGAGIGLVTGADAISGGVSLEFKGATSTSGWTTTYSENTIFTGANHAKFRGSATYCLDLTNANSIVNMSVLMELNSQYTGAYAWYRVKANGTVLSDMDNGKSSYTNYSGSSLPSYAGTNSAATTYTYDLSAYAGQSNVNITFEAACRYNGTSTSTYAQDWVKIDDINVFNVNPCTYYTTTASVINGASCNGASDGSAVATATNGSNTVSLSYAWSDGQTTDTAVGLAAGTYTCVVIDATNGCVDSVSVTIGEPSAIVLSGSVIDESQPLASDGSIDLSVSGGVPCVAVSTGYCSGGPTSTGDSEIEGITMTGDGGSAIAYVGGCLAGPPVTGLNDQTSTIVNVTSGGSYSLSVDYGDCSGSVYDGWGTAWIDWNADGVFDASEVVGSSVANPANVNVGPVTYTFTVPAGTNPTTTRMRVMQQEGATSGPLNPCATYSWGSQIDFGVQIDGGAQPYTYSWSTGGQTIATTEDLSGVGMGYYTVTVTDCNGCTETSAYLVSLNTVYGCMDATAWNYNSSANVNQVSATDTSNPCIAFAYACIDSLAINYVPFDSTTANTNDASMCCFISGCTNPFAANYDATACYDDGSCNYCDTTNIVVAPFSESFENDTVTTWAFSNVSGDTFDWTRDSGGTGSSSTGPQYNGLNFWSIISYPNSSSDGDYYMYIETSSPRVNGDYADLRSACIDVSALANPSLTFDYNMYGTQIDTLDVYVNGMLAWSAGGNKGTSWLSASVDLSTYGNNVSINFRGTRGAGYWGDIAIDNLGVDEAPTQGCMNPLACNYDSTASMDDGSCFILATTSSTVDASCNGGSDGSATVSSNDTTSTFVWSNGTTGASASGLSAGTYTVVNTNAAGCSDTATVVIGEPTAIAVSVATLDAQDSTSASGSIDLTVSGGVACQGCAVGSTPDTTWATSVHTSNYNFNTRGWGFTAQSSFILSAVKASDGNTTVGLDAQVVQIHDITNGTVLFYSGYQPLGWIPCAVNIVQGNQYAILGAKTFAPGGTGNSANSYNSYGAGSSSTTTVNFTIDGIATAVYRAYAGYINAGANATAGIATAGSIGRLDIQTCSTPVAPYTFSWSNGATTEDLSAAAAGTYTCVITDCNGCTSSITATVGVAVTPGCMDPTMWNYNPLANVNDSSCIPFAYGCLDSTAANYDAAANTNQVSASDSTDPCFYCDLSTNMLVDMQLNIPTAYISGQNHASEVSWVIINTATGDTAGVGGIINGYPYPLDNGSVSSPGGMSSSGSIMGSTISTNVCMPYGCYAVQMYDAWGDGWGGVTYSLVDQVSGFVYASNGLVHVGGAPYTTSFGVDSICIDACSQFAIMSGSVTDLTCNSGSDGAIDVTINDPSGSATYAWSNGATTEDLSGISAGTYTVVITNASGCVDSATYTVNEPSAITASMSVVNSSGLADGSINLTVSGGTPCITNASLASPQAGGNGQSGTTFNLINTSGGDLDITGVSQGGPTAINTTMEVYYYPGDVYALGLATPGTGFGGAWMLAGTATVTTSGGSLGYIPVTGMTIPAGATYTVRVQAQTGSPSYTNGTGTVGVTPWTSDANLTITEGHGGSTTNWFWFSPRNFNGEIHYGNPGVTAYTFTWSNGDTTEDISGLAAGTYCVTITDCNGCTISACDSVSVTLTPGCMDMTAANYNPLANVSDSSCLYAGCMDITALNYDSTATISCDSTTVNDTTCCVYPCPVVVAPVTEAFSGGILPLSVWPSCNLGWQEYQTFGSGWVFSGTPGFGASTNGRAAGTYAWIDFSSTDIGASLEADDVDISGLTSPVVSFDYFSEAGVAQSFGNPNIMYVEAWDGSSWTQVTMLQLYQDPADHWSNYSFDLAGHSYGSNLVKLRFRGESGGSGYDYYNDLLLDNVSIANGTPSVFGCTDTAACNYNASATANDGSCVASISISVSATNASCNGIADGSATATTNSSTATYSWSNGATGATVSGLAAGTYIVTASEGSCSATDTVVITEPAAIVLSGVVTNATVNGASDGAIDLSVSGGVPCAGSTATYCSGGPTSTADSEVASVSLNGDAGTAISYTGCPGVSGLNNQLALLASVTSGNSYTVDVDFSSCGGTYGGYGQVWIDWNGDGVFDSSEEIGHNAAHTGVNSFTFTVPVGTPAGTTRMRVMQQEGSSATYPLNPCATYSWGSMIDFSIEIDGGSPPYTVAWNNGASSEDLSGITAGTYSVTVTDCNGCTETASYTVTEPTLSVAGCMDINACNYDSTATVSDSSCTYPGCTDSTQFNYDPTAGCDDGSCLPIIYGCTDSTALNYYAAANTNNGTCVYAVYGCTDSTACNYDSTANVDDGSCNTVYGCTDPSATNYDASATCDDGSCIISTACNNPTPTGLNVTEIIQNQVRVNWTDANTSNCLVLRYRIWYRVAGSSDPWSARNAQASGLCNFGLSTTSKVIYNLTPATTYEYKIKAWYCNTTGASTWSPLHYFTTADPCPNVINFSVSSPTTTRATFAWDTTAAYSFVRIQLRADTTNAPWFTAGGFGVMYPTLTRNKNGLIPGQSYRAAARTWCNPSGGRYRADNYTAPIFWTQPTSIRLEGENTAITNLDVYPNPSRDIFNVSFVSDEVQNLEVSIINVVGEAVYTANLDQFVGQFTKEVSLATYPKGVYFLEITTDKGVINKKLILQ